MLDKLILFTFDLLYLGGVAFISIIVLLIVQCLIYQLSNKKINLYKKFINSKFLWK